MFRKLSLLAALVGEASMAAIAFAPSASAEEPPRRPGTTLAGAGVLDAQGDGLIAVRGRMNLEVSADEGILLVKDVDGDAVVRVDGNGRTAQWNGFTVYFGFNGTATVKARDAGVVVVGKNIDLHVEGRGWAFLKGEGEYTVNGEGPFPWSPEGGFAGIPAE